MDNLGDLRVLLGGACPLLFASADDEPRLFDLLRRAAAPTPVWTWTATSGLARGGQPTQYDTDDPHKALEFVRQAEAPGVFVFADGHHLLDDHVIVRQLREIAQQAVRGRTVVFSGPDVPIPPELVSKAHRWRLRPPTREELIELVQHTLSDLAARGMVVRFGPEGIDELVDGLRGLGRGEAERLLLQSALADQGLSSASMPRIRRAKAELLAEDEVLELIEGDELTLDDVGGLEALKDWLRVRHHARHVGGLDPPRGIMLAGVPGCGKSLVAKALARSWRQPLVLLDPARLFARYVGESEQRLGRALETVEVMAPAVLWIDEIEKGFSTGASDGGVSTRVLGSFLRWLQDRPDGVFVVATANHVHGLPPEFLRRGRFDQVFFVDLPGSGAREVILRTHLAMRGQDPEGVDTAALAHATDGFSGAELEAVVVGACYRAYAAERPLDTGILEAEIAETVPLSVARVEEIERLRAWARERATPA